MQHPNAPLSAEGRRRLVERCRTRPIAHVAAEMGISRACASKWLNRYRRYGDIGLLDRSSTPRRQPTATPPEVVELIETWRRERKWSASRITFELNDDDVQISRRTVTRIIERLGLNRRRFIDPNGDNNRRPCPVVAKRPGHMLHVDVKKVGRIPTAADGESTAATPNKPERPHGPRPRPGNAGMSTCTPPSTDTPASPTPNLCRMRRRQPQSPS